MKRYALPIRQLFLLATVAAFSSVAFVGAAQHSLAKATAAAPPGTDPSSAMPAAVIALIDLQRLQQEAVAATKVQKQLDEARVRFQARTAAEETDLRQAERELVKLRTTASADVYTQRELELRQRFSAVERSVQARRRALDKAFAESNDTIRKTMLSIVGEIASSRGIDIVLPRSNTLWGAANFDITDEVLGQLNAKMPSLNVNVAEDALTNGAKNSPTGKQNGQSKVEQSTQKASNPK